MFMPLTDFMKEFSPEGAVLIGNSIGSLTALAAAAKCGSEAARYLRTTQILHVPGQKWRFLQCHVYIGAASDVVA